MTKIGIHIFRRDLRIYDNVALHLLGFVFFNKS